jgi:hypothetical protein
MIQLRADYPGAAKSDESLPCPVCLRPIETGHTITRHNAHVWRHVSCEDPGIEPENECLDCGEVHSFRSPCEETG